ncbi:PP2C family protein-serine/threonine phosphatase [Planctomicrobium sp. SH668]|uniref:PP2C family protein-serine/threonine phosphatase n=1 Tax=Planctomicrobium sp. SH668 TaxID=3448126 RepID=UPI003F5C5BC8
MRSQGEYRWGGSTTTGNFRANNEDKFYIDPDGRFFLVADGMGGQSAGERASELAIDLVAARLKSLPSSPQASAASIIFAIDQAVAHANSEIMVLGEIEPSCKNMGTTIAFLVNVNSKFYIGGVGDSRVYHLRNGELKQLTEDHSLTQALLKAKTITEEEAKTHRYKNVLYRYLGTRDGGSGTHPFVVSPEPGDRFMLCSDGITDGTINSQIQVILEQEQDPATAARKLIAAAEAGGSKDNITCVCLYVD